LAYRPDVERLEKVEEKIITDLSQLNRVETAGKLFNP